MASSLFRIFCDGCETDQYFRNGKATCDICSATTPLDIVLNKAMEFGTWSDLTLTHTNCLAATSTLRTVWKFDYDSQFEQNGKNYYVRDFVDTPEFREILNTLLYVPNQIAVEVCPLEKDASGNAYIWVAMNRIEHACDCGAPVENGRMTCLCWADEEDLRDIDRNRFRDRC